MLDLSLNWNSQQRHFDTFNRVALNRRNGTDGFNQCANAASHHHRQGIWPNEESMALRKCS